MIQDRLLTGIATRSWSDIVGRAEAIGALPVAPRAMPLQVVEGRLTAILGHLPLRPGAAPRPGG